jgi:hypothetical protein
MRARLFTFLVLAAAIVSAVRAADVLSNEFRAPPSAAKPRTFWFWMNGNVSADGITRDLEAMQRAGVGGVMAYDGSDYLPAGPAGYLQPAWRSLMTHAIKEANRLGLDFGMHNGPGWSSSGGPWVPPELSMQQLVWTETTVTGGRRVELDLPPPHRLRGYYADALVVAFPAAPAEQVGYEDEIATVVRSDGAPLALAALSDGRFDTTTALAAGQSVTLEFKRPLEMRALTAWPPTNGRFAAAEVAVSTDGRNYTPLVNVGVPGRHGILAPAARSFPPTTARFVRLTATRAGEWGDFVFHRSDRLADWVAKANFDYRVAGQLRLPAAVESGLDPASVVDLSTRTQAGRLTWDAPPGAWTILRFGHTSTGKENVAASAAGRGLEVDKFNPAAIEFHFKHVVERIRADAAAAGATGPQTLEVDSYEAGMQNWTAALPAEFARRVGYELWRYAPALTGRIVGDAAVSERFLFDFRRVQADLMAENYYGRLGELARAHGLRYYVEGYGPGNFDELRVSGLPDVPMTEFWTRTPWTPNRAVKMVTSAAHIYGKRLVAAEAFTGEFRTSRWLEYPYALKILGDEMMAHGVNQFYFHRFAHQPHPDAVPGMAMGPYGFHFDRTNTWFDHARAWTAYLARTQALLRHGTPVADVLYYTGERAPEAAQLIQPVLPAGYTYDLVNTDVLLRRLRVERGDYVLPEGGRYRVLVLPPDLQAMRPALVEKLREFVAAGGTVVGPEPKFSPTLEGFPGSEEVMRRTAAELWQHPRVFASASIADALRQLRVPPDVTWASPRADTALSWQHRRLENGDLFFIANRQRRPEEVVVSFRGMGQFQPEIWRPESGEQATAAVFQNSDGRALVPLRLEPGEAVFVRFHRLAGPAAATLTKDGTPLLSTQVALPHGTPPSGDFTMSAWVKPDTNLRLLPTESATGRIDEVGKFYAIPADPGDRRFGAGAATAGLAVGRNGVFVVERSSDACPAVLVHAAPISGWTHVAVVYRDGIPELWLNGVLARRGLKTGRNVHSGVGAPPPPLDYTLNFPALTSLARAANETLPPSRGAVFFHEGNLADVRDFARPLSEDEIAALAAAPLPEPELPTATEVTRSVQGASALVWRSGAYRLGDGPVRPTAVAAPQRLDGPWRVDFQPGRGAPESIELPELRSLHLQADAGVRHFSGLATYRRSFSVPAAWLAADRRVVLDLGRVEVTAGVRVNGREVGVAWKEPYRLDVTDFVRVGENTLEVEVATLWVNRLIGDEALPPEADYGIRDEQGNDPHGITRLPDWYREGKPKPPGGRVTFTTWKFYDRAEPLVASGLLGPVRLLNPVRVRLE